MELSLVVVFGIYMGIRVRQSELYILPHLAPKEDSLRVSFWVVFNTILLVLQVMKLLYFMRVSEELAKIVKLTSQVFVDVFAFTVFLCFWILIFLYLYIIAGINFEGFDNVNRELSMTL